MPTPTDFAYGTSIPIIVFAAISSFGSIFQFIRTRKFPIRYLYMLLAANGMVIVKCSNLAGTTPQAALVAIWFGRVYIPLLYSVFFDASTTMITASFSNNNHDQDDEGVAVPAAKDADSLEKSTAAPELKPSKMLLLPAYIASFITYVLIITITVAVGMTLPTANKGDIATAKRITALDDFNVYSGWSYVLLAIIQLAIGYKHLGKAFITLSIYFLTLAIPGIGGTISQALSKTVSATYPSTGDIISFVMFDLVSTLGLIYACWWCSTRSWTPSTKA
ncbi:hypothetical protein BDA99DRAFT_565994 [Phascolomyces articulosus]|uniref:Uncharacterized protein n=1 Tax=Phascolomyces articulosus TaxID=60185 RepID=A0AAD5JY35_9FUNG|nr:hypothetical protein BDA99DRAFT_565994 [Phascolomyces articulosus]